MLNRLIIKNFAIIEDVDLYFHDGLTVLTGETGAGKSLIIDSISLLLGERANNEMIRANEDKAIITGYFSYQNERIDALLDKYDIPASEVLEISRIISNNKNVIKINNKNVSLNELKIISRLLGDIHQQLEMVKLLDKTNYLSMVDNYKFDLVEEYKSIYLDSLNLLKEKTNEYYKLVKRAEEIKDKKEFYQFELKELEAFDLKPNEEEENQNNIDLLSNYDKIYSLLEQSKQIIDQSSLEDLYNLIINLNKLSQYQNKYEETKVAVENHYYELKDLFDSLKKDFKHLDYDPKYLEQLINRNNEIKNLKKKYKKDVNELIAYKDELKIILNNEEDLSSLILQKKNEISSLYHSAFIKAMDLHNIRVDNARKMEKEIEKHLLDLALPSRFEICIRENKENGPFDLSIFTDNGIDDIEFNIETNIGEGLKPLHKIVSGGEASRIMLAFKLMFIKVSNIETVIFDEIDSGISGNAATKVANKIYQLSLSRQVMIITHLPQVAAKSKTHLKIEKVVKDKRTKTTIRELSLNEKINEIAALISNGKISEKQLEYAKELVINK